MPEQAPSDPIPKPLFVPPEDLREDFDQLYTVSQFLNSFSQLIS